MANLNDFSHLCFECKSCQQICSKQAIRLVANEEGFSYPQIDAYKCINCGCCVKVCPAINSEEKKQDTGKVYAAQLKDKKILRESSSGGIFSLIAEEIIKRNGIVYGAAWDSEMQLHHIGVESLSELVKLRGSKYVHSNIESAYMEVRNELNKDRWVYFTGTPCQIAGLRLFLRKDYPKLITSDIICHGTPSQKIFNRFLKQIKIEQNVNIVEFQFRDKTIFGWSCSSSFFSIDKITGKKVYHYYDKNIVAYFQAFIHGHITREDCYRCPFACTERVGDITLADYWDIRKHHPEIKNIRYGVSLVIVNSDKGNVILETVKNKVILIESSIEKALNTSNHNLKNPTNRPKERDKSYKEASNDFVTFRDKYVSMARPEAFFHHAYRMNKLKRFPIFHLIFKLLGKA